MKKLNQIKLQQRFIDEHGLYTLFSPEMIQYMEFFYFDKNEYLCKQGEEMSHMLFLVKGKVKVYSGVQNGKNLLLCFYEGFQLIGDAEVMGEYLASSTVQAVEEGYCLAIAFDVINSVLRDDLKFFKYITKSLSDKLLRSSRNSSINLLYPLENRLAAYLVGVSREQYEDVIEVNLKEISELLGTSYRHLLRVVRLFIQEEYIRKDGNKITILNKKEIRQLGVEVYT